jgi:predicted small secreted protein
MKLALCVGIGLAAGIIVGIALRSYALGVLIGICVGALICFWQIHDRSRR